MTRCSVHWPSDLQKKQHIFDVIYLNEWKSMNKFSDFDEILTCTVQVGNLKVNTRLTENII